jgi:hypothetical protein
MTKEMTEETTLTKALELAVKYISEACIHAPVYIQNKDWWIKAVKGEVDTLPVFKPWVKTTSLLQKQQELSS